MKERKKIRRTFLVHQDSWEVVRGQISGKVCDYIDILAYGEGENDPDTLRYLMDRQDEKIKIRNSEIETLRSQIRIKESENRLDEKRKERYKDKFNLLNKERVLAETYTQINDIINDNLRTHTVDEIYEIVKGYGLIRSLEDLGIHLTIDEFKNHIRKIVDAGYLL